MPADFVDFDAARKTTPDRGTFNFTLAGEQFVIPRNQSCMPLLDMAALVGQMAAAGDTANADPQAEMRAMSGLGDFVVAAIPEAEQARFRAALRRFGPGLDELVAIVRTVIVGVSGRPLEEPSPSPATSAATSPEWSEGSWTPAGDQPQTAPAPSFS